MGANILSNRPHNRSREHHSHATRFAEAMQAISPACMQTAPNPAEGKARRRAGKEKQPKTGKEEKEREIHAAVEPRAELKRADETKGIGENKIHVTSETVSPNANMGSRKELCEGRTYSSRGHGSTQVLAVELLEKVSVRMRCARPTLSSRRTWYPY